MIFLYLLLFLLLSAFLGFLFLPYTVHAVINHNQREFFLAIKIEWIRIRLFEMTLSNIKTYKNNGVFDLSGELSMRILFMSPKNYELQFPLAKGIKFLFHNLAFIYLLKNINIQKEIRSIIFHPYKKLVKSSYLELVLIILKLIYKSFKINSSLSCSKLTLKSKVGIEDAALTAITSGILWNIKGIFISKISKIVKMRTKPNLVVNPSYGEQIFKLNADGIFTIRLGYIITACIQLVIRAIIFKDK